MIRCPNCNREQPNSVITCDCGFNLQAYAEKLEVTQKQQKVVNHPYQVLPVFLVILRILGILSVVGGAVYAFYLFSQEESAWMSIAAFLGGILAGAPYLALSEALTILLQMSEKQDKLILALEKVEKKGK